MLTTKDGEREAVVEGTGKTERGPAGELRLGPSPWSHGPCSRPGAALLGVAGRRPAQLKRPQPWPGQSASGQLTALRIPTQEADEGCSPVGGSRELRS